MNTEQLPISFQELANLVRWHGYVCVSSRSFVASDAITHGWGPSTYLATVSACGDKLANLLCEAISNGGRMTEWLSIEQDGETLMTCEVRNEDDEQLVRFFK